ncbi:hypothetical protein PISMIDRAFT_99065 [Pisolithus microcarpus 441]|uniref:Uncharacterized protein n=1 Tax=Pisolithus microcarpus 441 TaxID=765257 RepID=A0A0C9ZPC1_9AGAM|nr:hypothetical protein PISMIDRAFT_99065 [Pisolithus microcarpus 441]
MQNRYAQHIWEQVSLPTGQVGPEVKAMNPPKPGKYGGQDDLDKFNDWLGQILKCFHTFKVTGPNCNEDHILYTGLYLEGLASQWYDQEIQHWTFEELISDKYDQTKFEYDKGALAYYNNLKHHVHQMVQPPDDYSFRRKFLWGLPHSIIKSIFEAHRISTEHLTIKEILEEVRCMETVQKAVNMHMRTSHASSGGKTSQGQNGSHPHGNRSAGSSTNKDNYKYFQKGNTLY